ncbi:MAG: FHA domain-containing protein [Kofleriaceae bacterium]
MRCVLTVPHGPSRRVDSSGILIGRKHDCDLVSDDASVSRRHALVRLTTTGAEVLALGRGVVEVNGKRCEGVMALADGDQLDIPGLHLNVKIEARRGERGSASSWRLERARGGRFGIVHSPFVIGGSNTDDLIVKRWPAGALRFHVAQGELYFDATVANTRRNGVDIEPGGLEVLVAGDEVTYRKELFLVRHIAGDETTTAPTGAADLPTRVEVETLPRGGRVVFATAEGDRAVFLADRRLDLVTALLRPPDDYKPGEFIPDEIVASVVWPRNPSITRAEINVLISRCRRDLVEAGLAGARLIERAPGGGGTRLALASGAAVTFH